MEVCSTGFEKCHRLHPPTYPIFALNVEVTERKSLRKKITFEVNKIEIRGQKSGSFLPIIS